MKSKSLSLVSTALMAASLFIIALDLLGYLFVSYAPSSRTNDVAFVTVLILGTLFFFVGGLLDQHSSGPANNRWDESNRQASIRSAWYGIVACCVSFILLAIALVYTH